MQIVLSIRLSLFSIKSFNCTNLFSNEKHLFNAIKYVT